MITFTPVRSDRKNSAFDLRELVNRQIGASLQDGDILVISSKFMAISEGRTLSLHSILPGDRARQLAQQYDVPAELCELILRESDEVIGGVPGFILTLRDGLLTPNAGIDKSNIELGRVVLYPSDPLQSAIQIVESIKSQYGVSVGVVVSDSRLMPTRMGTTGVALAAVGFEAIRDMRGKPDLFGHPLKVTRQAIADDLCTGAQLVMGEANESTPIVIVKGIDSRLLGKQAYSSRDFSIPPSDCVYMRSFRYDSSHSTSQADSLTSTVTQDSSRREEINL